MPISALSFVVVLGLLPGALATAATFTVDDTADQTDANPGDGSCQTFANTCTLRAAIQETNALPGQDEVNLPQGQYQLTIPGNQEDAAMAGDLDITDDLVLTGSGADETIIDGGVDIETNTPGILDRVIQVLPGASLEASDLTFQGGIAQDHGCNGGVLYNAGSAVLENVNVRRGFADACIVGPTTYVNSGGGVSNVGEMTLREGAITGNIADLSGGGLANGPGGILNAIGTQIEGNLAGLDDIFSEGIGGGFFHLYNGTVEGESRDGTVTRLEKVLVRDNHALFGGGLYVNGPSIEVLDSIVEHNEFEGLRSPRRFIPPSDLRVIRSTFRDNTADGIVIDGGRPHILDSLSTRNSGSGIRATIFAGGALIDRTTMTENGRHGAAGDIRMVNSTSSGNQESGVFFTQAEAIGSLIAHSTIANNRIGIEMRDPAFSVNDFVTFRGNILDNIEADCAGPGVFVSQGRNVISGAGDVSTCAADASKGDITGVHPLLEDLELRGGLTATHALMAGSPAIDTVPIAECNGVAHESDPPAGQLLIDQRGLDRPGTAVAACDAGAVEHQGMDEPGFVLPVGVDIRPHVSHNWIISFSPLPVPVAIVGAADFDVRDIDVETLRFGPAKAEPVFDLTRRLVFRLNHRDVNNDGLKDLVSHYRQGDTGLASADSEACIQAETLDGTVIHGCDSVVVIN